MKRERWPARCAAVSAQRARRCNAYFEPLEVAPLEDEPLPAGPGALLGLDDDLLRSALEPAPALSRLHAVRLTARSAAVNAAVRVLTVMIAPPGVVKGMPLH